MRSDETWSGCPQFGTVPEMLARDEWILLRLNQYGAPSVHIMVSLFIKLTRFQIPGNDYKKLSLGR